jgi:hypothetical protein
MRSRAASRFVMQVSPSHPVVRGAHRSLEWAACLP